MEIDKEIRRRAQLKKLCEIIRGKPISDWAWIDWEALAGACYAKGKRRRDRIYTPEQAQMLLCLGHLRKHFPTRLVTYRSLREYWQANIYKIEEALDKACNDEPITKPEFVELIPLLQVKKCCDEIMGRSLSRETWSNWKQHIGIPKNSKGVESGKAALLVYMACWRQDHWTTEFPSMKQLLWMMGEATRLGMTIDTFSSGKMQHQWEMQGCKGEELPRYLAAHGYRISVFTLYKWGEGTFSKKKHYSVSELGEWKRRASKCRKYAA